MIGFRLQFLNTIIKMLFLKSIIPYASLIYKLSLLSHPSKSIQGQLSYVTIKRMIVTCMISVQIAFVGTAYGQINTEDTAILLKAIRHVILQEQIVYVDNGSVNRFNFDLIKETIRKGKIIDERTENSIFLTNAEQHYLLSQLRKRMVWTDKLFSNSTRINADSIWSFIKLKNAEKKEAINEAIVKKDLATIEFLRQDYPFVFTFAKPIYLRDKSVCLISFSAICGSECGRFETSFYKMENNEWTRWIIIVSGDF